MEVRVRDIKASCTCGSAEFHAPHAPPFRVDDVFTCATCHAIRPYGSLLDQIGEEAMRRTDASLHHLRAAQKKKGPGQGRPK